VATLTTQVVTRAGVTPTYGAAAGGGDAMACSDDSFLHVKNGGGAPITVTLAIPSGASSYSNVAYTNTQVSVSNGSEKMIGPIKSAIYADPTTALCVITYSAVTSVTVAALQVLEP
jgi:hypothetical protein